MSAPHKQTNGPHELNCNPWPLTCRRLRRTPTARPFAACSPWWTHRRTGRPRARADTASCSPAPPPNRRCPHCSAWGWTTRPCSTATTPASKVGIITRQKCQSRASRSAMAKCVGHSSVIEIAGYLYARDFPDVMRELRGQIRRRGRPRHNALGMSYEITDARIDDLRAAIWTCQRVHLHRRRHPAPR